jgi:hypothetical protein
VTSFAPVGRPLRVFLLSPAHCGGERARVLLSARADFPLARQLRGSGGAPLGEVFSFLSGLYFRGKLAYARRFGHVPSPGGPLTGGGTLIITADSGLRPPEMPVTVADLRAAAGVDISVDNPRYHRPLRTAARALAGALAGEGEVILLGSVATAKYVDVLLDVFGEQLRFPSAFVGRGDMSRGGLLLRCVSENRELDYVPVTGALRRGPRPPRLGARVLPPPVTAVVPADP